MFVFLQFNYNAPIMELLGDKSALEMISAQLVAIDAEETDELRRLKHEAELSPDDPEVWFNLGGAYDGLASAHNVLTANKAMLIEAESRMAEQEEADGGDDALSAMDGEADSEALQSDGEADDEALPSDVEADGCASCGDECAAACPDEHFQPLHTVQDEKSRAFYNKALECYRKVLQLEPQYYGVLCQMGLVYSYLNEHDEAVNAFKRALEQDEDYSAAYYLGHLYMEMGDEAAARLYLQKAQEGEDSVEDLEKY